MCYVDKDDDDDDDDGDDHDNNNDDDNDNNNNPQFCDEISALVLYISYPFMQTLGAAW